MSCLVYLELYNGLFLLKRAVFSHKINVLGIISCCNPKENMVGYRQRIPLPHQAAEKLLYLF